MKLKNSLSIILILYIIFTFIFTAFCSVEAVNAQSNETDPKDSININIAYLLSKLDDKMTDAEKSRIIATYIHEGSIYKASSIDQKDYGIFQYGEAVCAGGNRAYETLMNAAGLLSKYITSSRRNHASNLIFIDGYWSYTDSVPNNIIEDITTRENKASNEFDIFVGPTGLYYGNEKQAREAGVTEGTHYFLDDAKSYFISLPTDDDTRTFKSQTTKSITKKSAVYYDDNYMYYTGIISSEGIKGLFKENRTTHIPELITSDAAYVSYNYPIGIVKENNLIYFVSKDKKSIKTYNTVSKTYSNFYNISDGKEIYLLYTKYGKIKILISEQGAKKSTGAETIDIKDLSTWPTKGEYIINNNESQYKLSYYKTSKGILINDCEGLNNNEPNGKLVIPDIIDGLKVIGIGKDAFYNKTYLTGEFVFPKYLEFIGNNAFYNCKISSIVPNNNIKSICNYAFYNCKLIGNIKLPNTLTYLGDSVFSDSNIDILDLKDTNIKYIYSYQYGKINNLILPKTIEQIKFTGASNSAIGENIVIYSKDITNIEITNTNKNNNFNNIYIPTSSTTQNTLDNNNIEYQDISSLSINNATISVNDITNNIENIHDLYIDKDEIINLSVSITPELLNSATTIWSSDNSNIVEVTPEGKVTGKNYGNTNLKVSIESRIITIPVVVEEKYNPNEYLKLNHYTYQFNNINETTQMKASLSNGNATPVTWSSQDSNIVAVDSNGNLTAKQGGFVKIYANSKYYGQETCLIYVNFPVTLSDGELAYVGDLNGDGIFDMTDASLISEWYKQEKNSNDNKLIADLDGNGVIDANDATVISEIYRMEAFTIGNLATIREVRLNKTDIEMQIGDSTSLIASLIASNTLQDKTLNWSSSNTNVATVNSRGNITALNEGKAIITVTTSNGKQDTCTITVKKYNIGDVNGDGKVNGKDWIRLYEHISETNELTGEELNRADVNGDGKVNGKDWIRLYEHINETNPLF